MNTSEKYGFYLPSRDGDDIADINKISENFNKIDKHLSTSQDKATSAESLANQAIEMATYARAEAENAVEQAAGAVGLARGANERVDALILDVGNLQGTVKNLGEQLGDVEIKISEVASDAEHAIYVANENAEKIGDIEAAFDELHDYAQALVNGGGSV